MNPVLFQETYIKNFDYFASVMADKSLDLNQEINYLNQIISESPIPLNPQCNATEWSVCDLMINLCQLGLTLNPAKKMAYVLFNQNETGETILKLYPGYRGEIAIATLFNVIKSANAVLVYEKDTFNFCPAANEVVHSVTSLSIDPLVRGNCIGGYCRSVLTDDTVQISQMSIEELDSIAQQQIENNLGHTPWNSIWCSEMRRVALYRRAAKDWRQLIVSNSNLNLSLLATDF